MTVSVPLTEADIRGMAASSASQSLEQTAANGGSEPKVDRLAESGMVRFAHPSGLFFRDTSRQQGVTQPVLIGKENADAT
jgi:hypothetical protein